MPPRKVVFVSYYTPNYRKWAVELRNSLSVLSLEHDIVPIEHQCDSDVGKDRWQANVRYKPQFILEMLEKHKDAHAVVWVDADAIVERVPSLFFKMREDLGVNFIPHPRKDPRKYEMLSGTVYVRNSKAGLEMMRQWVKAMPYIKKERAKLKMSPLLKPEQQVLQAMLSLWKCIPTHLYNNADSLTGLLKDWPKHKVSVLQIPEPYCRIRGNAGPGPGVVTHGQASREWRWPEKFRRKRLLAQQRGQGVRVHRSRRAPKPVKAMDKKARRGLPISRRRRRRMGR